jgi:superfamily II DNA or RNA helicase
LKATLGSELTISGYTEDDARQIKSNLVTENPNWVTAMSMGKSVWGLDQKLRFYKEVNGELIVPIGFLSSLKAIDPNLTIVDNRYESKQNIDLEYKDKEFPLYSYQATAVDAMAATTNGVLCAITAAGKTVMACALIAKLAQPTLILVDTIELANQFTARLKTFTTVKKVGRIGSGRFEVEPITVATLQTITRISDIELSALKFGVVIVDEVHIVPALTYSKAMGKLNSKRKYGLSATPERVDGLTKVIHWLTGPLIHHVPEADLADKIIKPSYCSIDTEYIYPLFDSSEYGNMITHMGTDVNRNNLILKTLANYPTQQCVLLCHRQEHVNTLQAQIPGSVALLSSTKKKDREKIIKQLESGEKRIVITTWQLFHKGIDLAELEILLICAPTRSRVWLKQSAGRLMRVSKKISKKPLIVDFADKKVDLLKYQFYARRKVLQNI